MPTTEQALACMRVCQMLTNGYQPIYLFRYNPDTTVVYILAGVSESIEILVPSDGEWSFADE